MKYQIYVEVKLHDSCSIIKQMYKYTCSKNQGHVKFCKYISRSSGFCESTKNDVKIANACTKRSIKFMYKYQEIYPVDSLIFAST